MRIIFSRNRIIMAIFIILVFLLPYLEGDLRIFGYILLLFSSGLTGVLTDRKNLKLDILELLFAFFMLSGAVSTVFTQVPSRSLLELLRYLSYFILLLVIRRLPCIEKDKYKKIYIGAILFNSLLLSLISWSYLLPVKPFPIPGSGMNLYYAVFGHNNLANLLMFAIPIALFLLIDLFSNKANVKNRDVLLPVLSTLIIFYVFTFITTFSKSGYIVMIFISGIIILQTKTVKLASSRVFKFLIFLPALIFFAFLFLFLNTYFFKIRERPIYSMINKPLYADWRWDYFRIAGIGLSQSPIVGIGLDNFRYYSKRYQSKPLSWSDYGENYYLTLFSETGIWGGLAMVILIMKLLNNIRKKNMVDGNLAETGIYFALLGSASKAFFSVDWYFLSVFLYFWIGTALVLPFQGSSNKRVLYVSTIAFKILALLMILVSICYLSGLIMIHKAKKGYKTLLHFGSILTMFDANMQVDIGKIYLRNNQFFQAQHYFEKAVRLEKEDFNKYIFLAELFIKQNEENTALYYYLKALALNPLDNKQLFRQVFVLCLKKTEKYLGQNQLGNALSLLRMINQAFVAYNKETSGDKIYHNALTLLNNNKNEEAITIMKQYINIATIIPHKADITGEEIISTLPLLLTIQNY